MKMDLNKHGEKGLSKTRDLIPARITMTLLIFSGMCLIFAQRVSLNVAMVAMVNGSAEVELPQAQGSHCPVAAPEVTANHTTSNSKQGTYPWTPSTQGVILASYFYGYVVSQVLGGRVADRVGAKRLFGGATVFSSALTCLTPTVAALPGPAAVWMVVLRVTLGFVHGMNYPSAYTLISRWSPVQERGTLLSVCVIGTHFGVVLSMPLTGFLCEHDFGWSSAFYLLGSAGFVWGILWHFLVFESPADHPRISPRELHYIRRNIPFVSNEKMNAPVPWLKVARSGPVWAVTVAKFCGAWSFICFQSKLPAYLDEVLHLPIQKNGLVNACLFGALCCSIVLSGKASDLMRTRCAIKTTTIRKAFEAVALLGPAGCMVGITLVRCNADAVIALLVASMALFGLCGGGDVSVIVDMAPDFAGKIFGVSNAIASIPGILSPIAAGYFLEGNRGDVLQWTCIFYISVGMYVVGAFVFLLFGSAEVQPWGRLSSSSDDDDKKTTRTLSTIEANLVFVVPVIVRIDDGKDMKKNAFVSELTKF